MEVIEILLKGEALNDSVLKVIDKGIPYQLIFLLKRGEEYQLCMGYKETETSAVKEYFKTDWMAFESLPLQISGLTLDEVCDNFIRQIHGSLQTNVNKDLKTELAESKEQEKLQKRIALLEKKLLTEKQFKKQMAIRAELLELKNHGIHGNHGKDF